MMAESGIESAGGSRVQSDPHAIAIAQMYAQAFVSSSSAVGIDEALAEFQSFVDDVLKTQPEYADVLLDDAIGRDQKIALIDRTAGAFASEHFTRFLKVLASHERMSLLTAILPEAQKIQEERTNRRRVQVTSAVPLSEDMLSEVRQRLDEALPFEPIVEPRVDPNLLGGLVIQVGDRVYDTSLRVQLKQLKARLRQRTLHEIQSGRDRFSHPEGD